jgi:hypothetical protein
MKTAGILSGYYVRPNFIGELKQTLLLFDKAGIPMLNGIYDGLSKPNSIEDLRYLINELKLLEEKGYLFNAWLKSPVPLKREIDFKAFSQEFNMLSQLIQQSGDIQLSLEAAARHCSLILNNQKKQPDFVSVPLVSKLTLPANNIATQSDVLKIIIEKIPLPDELTPWESIFEFKSNPDNIGKFAGLKSWINKITKTNSSVSEIKDELEFLLYKYSKSLDIHNIKYKSGILQTFVVGTSELIENTIRLKFSNVAKGLFSAQQAKADLFNLELSAPGNEIAYIYEASKAFS